MQMRSCVCCIAVSNPYPAAFFKFDQKLLSRYPDLVVYLMTQCYKIHNFLWGFFWNFDVPQVPSPSWSFTCAHLHIRTHGEIISDLLVANWEELKTVLRKRESRKSARCNIDKLGVHSIVGQYSIFCSGLRYKRRLTDAAMMTEHVSNLSPDWELKVKSAKSAWIFRNCPPLACNKRTTVDIEQACFVYTKQTDLVWTRLWTCWGLGLSN